MTKNNKLHKTRYNPNKDFGKQRTVRVINDNWNNWEAAADIAGVSRNEFVVTVCNYAADQILTGKAPGGGPRNGVVQDKSTGKFKKLEGVKTIWITTSTGTGVSLEVIPELPISKVQMTRDVFMDLPYVDDYQPSTRPFRRWYKNIDFVKNDPNSVAGWWYLGVPRDENGQPFIDFYVIELPSTIEVPAAV